jgi:signal transduction histidine kinase
MARTEAQGMDEAPQAPRAHGDEARAGHLGFVAHEIRNPLSTALWTAELLARMDPAERGGARGEKLSAICLRSVARVRQLVEDHFLSERLDIGGLPLRVEALGVAEALGAVVERRPEGSGPVKVELDPALAVEADRTLLDRALEAIVAVAGAEGTPVTVTAHAGEGEVTIVIGGRPTDPAALADPIKGAPSDPTGRALALPLARRIAHALGGALAAGEGGWRLTLRRAAAYTPRPVPAARP